MALQRLVQATMLALVAATISCTETDGDEGDAVNPPGSTDAGTVTPVNFTLEQRTSCTPSAHCQRTLSVESGAWIWWDSEGSVDITDELPATVKEEVYADLLHALQFGCPATVSGADFSRSASLWIDGVELSLAQGCVLAIGDVDVNAPGYIEDDLDAALALAATAAGCPAAYNPYENAEWFENSLVVSGDAERYICW